MTARDKIFKKLEKFKTNTPLEIRTFTSNSKDILNEFIKNAELAGAKTYSTPDEIAEFYNKELEYPFTCESTLGVAENGALWCYGHEAENRVNLFSCTELIISIKKEKLVSNMHEAYEKIDITNRGFGTFIAGPSKTADIEQSLVIGAHGAMGLHILLLD